MVPRPNTDPSFLLLNENPNDHLNATDPNLYAYPYFHPVGSTPLLYHLVITNFTSCCKSDQVGNANPSAVEPEETKSKPERQKTNILRRQLARRFQTRCLTKPMEVHWVDSCGENSLHRLCQSVRFVPHDVISNDVLLHLLQDPMDDWQEETEEEEEACILKKDNKRRGLLRRPLPKMNYTQSTLIFLVQKFLLEADSTCASVSNNWGETPLHQFARHCGFPEPDSNIVHGDDDDDLEDKKASFMASNVQFLNTLIQVCPESVRMLNYLNQLPLHEACFLSQSEDRYGQDNLTIPYSNISMGQLGIDFSATETSMKQQGNMNPYQAAMHLDVVNSLLGAYKEGVLVLDSKGRSPLCRAVESISCGSSIVKRLLEVMEALFVQRNRGPSSILLRRAILGWGSEGEHMDMHENRSVVSRTQILSPLEVLWKIITEQRKFDHNIPWLINYSESTISIEQVIKIAFKNHSSSLKNKSIGKKCQDVASLLVKQMGLVWEKIMILSCAAYHGSVNVQEHREVHAAIYCGAPPCIMNIILCKFQDRLTEIDDNGDTPLSFAISHFGKMKSKVHTKKNANEMDILQLILLADPTAASMSNKEGQLPLHVAIRNGIGWDHGTQDILRVNPDAVSVPDKDTGLFPFMLAASSDNFSFCERNLLLSRIFDLLQTDPSVTCGI